MDYSRFEKIDGSELLNELFSLLLFLFLLLASAATIALVAYRREIVGDRRDELIAEYESIASRLKGAVVVDVVLGEAGRWDDLLYAPIHKRSTSEDSLAVQNAREESRTAIVQAGVATLAREGAFIELEDALRLLLLLHRIAPESAALWQSSQELILERTRTYLGEIGRFAASLDVLYRSSRIAKLAADVSSGQEREWFYAVHDRLYERIYAMEGGRDTEDLSIAQTNMRRVLTWRLRELFQGDGRLESIYLTGNQEDSLVFIGRVTKEELTSIFHEGTQGIEVFRSAGIRVILFRGINGESALKLR